MLKTNDLNEIPEFGPVFILTDDVTFRNCVYMWLGRDWRLDSRCGWRDDQLIYLAPGQYSDWLPTDGAACWMEREIDGFQTMKTNNFILSCNFILRRQIQITGYREIRYVFEYLSCLCNRKYR